jgi:uncharacterized damage-inducible protein DinB
MTVRDLERLVDYGYWANRRLFQAVGQLTPEQFTRDVAGSYGSIRNTLVHTLSAEWGWLERCGGPARGGALKAVDYPTFESIRTVWSDVERMMREFLATLGDSDVMRIVEFTNPVGDRAAGQLGALLQHAAIHGVHHRGQVALLLRAAGVVPGNFDILFYDIEAGTAGVSSTGQ